VGGVKSSSRRRGSFGNGVILQGFSMTLVEQIGALADQHIVHVACGESHSLALSDRGQLFSWGAGSDGQLGLMTTEDSVAVPRLIQKLNQQTILQVSCGNWHCLALAAGNITLKCMLMLC